MSTTDILNELTKLNATDRLAILQRLSELEQADAIDPSPEMASAIRDGLESAQSEPLLSVEEVRARAKSWARQSS